MLVYAKNAKQKTIQT